MHDLPDAYSKQITAAVDKAKTARLRALAAYNEQLERVAEEFEADVAAAAAGLEAGMQARLSAFRGDQMIAGPGLELAPPPWMLKEVDEPGKRVVTSITLRDNEHIMQATAALGLREAEPLVDP